MSTLRSFHFIIENWLPLGFDQVFLGLLVAHSAEVSVMHLTLMVFTLHLLSEQQDMTTRFLFKCSLGWHPSEIR